LGIKYLCVRRAPYGVEPTLHTLPSALRRSFTESVPDQKAAHEKVMKRETIDLYPELSLFVEAAP
jgi:hypothetical protein